MQKWSLHRIIAILIVLAGLTLIVSQYVISIQFADVQSRRLTEERLVAIGSHFQSMSNHLLAQGEFDVLREGIASASDQPDLDIAILTDGDTVIVAATDIQWIGKPLSLSPWYASLTPSADIPEVNEIRDEQGNLQLVARFSVGFPGESVGHERTADASTLFMVMNLSSPWQSLLNRVKRMALISSAAVVAVAMLFWYAMHRIVSQPVHELADKSRQYSFGNFHASTHLQRIRELSEISTALDSLAVRAKASDQAQEASARLLDIVEHSINEIYIVDARNYQILSANLEAREKHGFQVDMQSVSFPWQFSPHLTEYMLNDFVKSLKVGTNETYTFETQFLHSGASSDQDSLYDVELTLQLLESVPPAVLLVIARDVSELKRQNEHLILRNRAMDALNVGVCISDAQKPDYPIVYTNAFLSRLSGYTQEELLGQPAKMLQGSETDSTARKRIDKAQASGVFLQIQLDSIRKDGTKYQDELSLSPVIDEQGVVTHYIGINDDISNELAMQQQVLQIQRLESVGQLSGGIAHDFNNILSIVLGNIELLAMELTDDQQLDLVAEAQRAAQMGCRLTNRLLLFAKRTAIESTAVDLNQLVTDSIDLIRSSLGEKVSVATSLDPELCVFENDQSQVENAIINLVINAKDAMPDGGSIHIRTANVAIDDGEGEIHDVLDGNYVELCVSDNGSGMSPEVRRHAIEPFYTTKASSMGTGLGLSTIYGLVRHSGGQMVIDSEPGKGTSVRLLFPVSEVTDTDRQSLLKTNESGIVQVAERVLLVEDDLSVRKVTKKRLQALNYDTVAVSSAREAVLKLQEKQRAGKAFDIVMTDVAMEQETSGYELALWILHNLPGCAVLLCTAYASDVPSELRDVPLLSKPYSIDELKQSLLQSRHSVLR